MDNFHKTAIKKVANKDIKMKDRLNKDEIQQELLTPFGLTVTVMDFYSLCPSPQTDPYMNREETSVEIQVRTSIHLCQLFALF